MMQTLVDLARRGLMAGTAGYIGGRAEVVLGIIGGYQWI